MALAAAASKANCEFCGRSGHTITNCFTFQKAQKVAKEAALKPKPKKRADNANAAKLTPESTPEAAEFAGNASTRLPDASDLSTPFQLDADFTWIADTGATSHMTRHIQGECCMMMGQVM
ncbi:hypothetical protein H0H81_011155 [Sphagnurus paluster]|uniref:Uncharacterized protein n=1 Tax=Sphagnurus paluster TaxID=117069 RepID=A0A9P7G3N5_9AGAR|nr:hypothetical protein H0H81_011155 [Sphagnurus paluster]